MRINLIEFDETKKRVAVVYEAPIYWFFKERIHAFCSYTQLKGFSSIAGGIIFHEWFNSETKMPIHQEHANELNKFARGCATAKGLID